MEENDSEFDRLEEESERLRKDNLELPNKQKKIDYAWRRKRKRERKRCRKSRTDCGDLGSMIGYLRLTRRRSKNERSLKQSRQNEKRKWKILGLSFQCSRSV